MSYGTWRATRSEGSSTIAFSRALRTKARSCSGTRVHSAMGRAVVFSGLGQWGSVDAQAADATVRRGGALGGLACWRTSRPEGFPEGSADDVLERDSRLGAAAARETAVREPSQPFLGWVRSGGLTATASGAAPLTRSRVSSCTSAVEDMIVARAPAYLRKQGAMSGAVGRGKGGGSRMPDGT